MQRGEYSITTDQQRFDIPAIHAFLSRTYWAKNIPIELVERSTRNSLAFGIFHHEQQIGFARVVTDKTTFAYLADVYVLEAHRGQGLSKWLMETILGHPDLQGLRRFLLGTHDAHGLYSQFGFRQLAAPDRIMEINRTGLYERVGS